MWKPEPKPVRAFQCACGGWYAAEVEADGSHWQPHCNNCCFETARDALADWFDAIAEMAEVEAESSRWDTGYCD